MIFPISTFNTYFKKFPYYKGIISVWGDFGVGKTTFALQTLQNTIGKENKSIYIFTKPNFPYKKINKIFQVPKEASNKIYFIMVNTFNDLYHIIFNLEFLVLRNFNVRDNEYKLIIIDSLTDLYRLELNREKKDKNYNLNYILNQIMANLLFLNDSYNIEILVINEKVQKRESGQILEVQSGGKVTEYWITLDIKIERTEVLKERKIILRDHSNGHYIEYFSYLTDNGFH